MVQKESDRSVDLPERQRGEALPDRLRRLYFVADNGTLTCLNAKTGQPYYRRQRLPKPYSLKASPVAAGGKLYLATEDGDVVVVKMGETYEVVATNKIDDEMFISSPAVAENRLYLRSQKSLSCIRESK